ncbi:hypothetical protein Taro_029339, partial [Colocasia esculenta]|nr:hypothetical protein [Colocasia esculenta]
AAQSGGDSTGPRHLVGVPPGQCPALRARWGAHRRARARWSVHRGARAGRVGRPPGPPRARPVGLPPGPHARWAAHRGCVPCGPHRGCQAHRWASHRPPFPLSPKQKKKRVHTWWRLPRCPAEESPGGVSTTTLKSPIK